MYFILGLEAQLLSTVVRKERPQLQEQKDGLVSAIAAAKRQLLGLEDELLRYTNTVLCKCVATESKIVIKSKLLQMLFLVIFVGVKLTFFCNF